MEPVKTYKKQVKAECMRLVEEKGYALLIKILDGLKVITKS